MTTARSAQAAPAIDWDALVGERVHMLMWGARITQTELAPRIGLTQAGLSKKLRGERGWSVEELVHVAAALNTTVAYLVGETEKAPTPQGEGQKLPGLDSNQEPIGSRPVASLADYRARKAAKTKEQSA